MLYPNALTNINACEFPGRAYPIINSTNTFNPKLKPVELASAVNGIKNTKLMPRAKKSVHTGVCVGYISTQTIASTSAITNMMR
jgi:hypothetical protein